MSNRLVPNLSVKVVGVAFDKRYRLASWTRKYKRLGRLVRKTMFDADDMIVVPKDGVAKRRVIETDIGIPDADARTVLPSDVVKDIVTKAEKVFIMDFCICRKSNGCEDYPKDHGCMFLGDGTDRIPREFGRVVDTEEAIEYIEECGRLGLVHIIGRNKLDSIWLNTRMDARNLTTICNCCPCCCLWNMVRDIDEGIGGSFNRMESVEVTVDAGRCTGCGFCVEGCFVRAITIEDGVCHIDDSCRGCGRCAENCPSEAITVTYDENAIGREVARISELVDL